MVKYNFIALLLVFITLACSESGARKDNSFLPEAQYNGDYVWLISDTTSYKGQLGNQIQEDFSRPFDVLPQDERSYKVAFSEYIGLNDLMKRWEVMIFAVDLNKPTRLRDYVSAQFKHKLSNSSSFEFSSFIVNDQWAQNQLVIYLVGASEKSLIEGYQKQKETINKMINSHVLKRESRAIEKLNKNHDLAKEIKTSFNFDLIIPIDYRSAGQVEGAKWFIKDIPKGYMSLVFYQESYSDSSMFEKERLIQKRDQVLGKFIKGEFDNEIMSSERRVLIEEETLNFNGQYGKKLNGLWRLKEAFSGGPFNHYAFYNPITQNIVYIDAFVMAPGEKKKPLMRELQGIIHTIKF